MDQRMLHDVLGRLEVAEAELAALRATPRGRRGRRPRRPLAPVAHGWRRGHLALALALALLLAGLPVGLLATDRFPDVPTGYTHHDDIGQIAAAGITTGFPDGTYKPEAFVTRGQMATFLARTAGLGGRAPIANAATALTAANATNAQNAVNAQTADTAANAQQLGGQPADAFLRSSGDVVLWYSPHSARGEDEEFPTDPGFGPAAQLEIEGDGTETYFIPLERAASIFGVALAVKEVQICYKASDALTKIDATRVEFGVRGEATTVVENGTDQTSEVAACYTVAPSSPVQADGSLELHLALATTMCTTTNSFTSCTGEVTLYSVRLTLTAV